MDRRPGARPANGDLRPHSTVTAGGESGHVTRMTTFSFTARPSTDQQKAIARHVGARRFAWNQSLRLVLDAEKQKKTDPTLGVPRTAYSLITAINTT